MYTFDITILNEFRTSYFLCKKKKKFKGVYNLITSRFWYCQFLYSDALVKSFSSWPRLPTLFLNQLGMKLLKKLGGCFGNLVVGTESFWVFKVKGFLRSPEKSFSLWLCFVWLLGTQFMFFTRQSLAYKITCSCSNKGTWLGWVILFCFKFCRERWAHIHVCLFEAPNFEGQNPLLSFVNLL